MWKDHQHFCFHGINNIGSMNLFSIIFCVSLRIQGRGQYICTTFFQNLHLRYHTFVHCFVVVVVCLFGFFFQYKYVIMFAQLFCQLKVQEYR